MVQANLSELRRVICVGRDVQIPCVVGMRQKFDEGSTDAVQRKECFRYPHQVRVRLEPDCFRVTLRKIR